MRLAAAVMGSFDQFVSAGEDRLRHANGPGEVLPRKPITGIAFC
jgi:hypothetical protein